MPSPDDIRLARKRAGLTQEIKMIYDPRSLFETVTSLGIQFDTHESDLYIPVNNQTKALLDNYEFKDNVSQFRSQIDGQQWFDVPFAYDPFWKHA